MNIKRWSVWYKGRFLFCDKKSRVGENSEAI